MGEGTYSYVPWESSLSGSYVKIKSDDPDLKNKSLPDETIDYIKKELLFTQNDRMRCSICCRFRIKRTTFDTTESDKYLYTITFGRWGTCRNFCKRLLRSDDFKFDKFKFESQITENMHNVTHIDTGKEMAMRMVEFNDDDDDFNRYESLIWMLYTKAFGYIMPIYGLCIDGNSKNKVGIVIPRYKTTLKEYLE